MRRLGSLSLSITLALTAGGCRDPAADPPLPLSVTPNRGPVSAAVPITIRGTGFNATATTDFAGREESALDVRFSAFLGPVPLRDVRLHADGSLTATVPEGLPIGLHDLEVVDPEGREGTLTAAYRVLADTDVARLVSTFRVEPIGPQVAGAPFTVTVTALDGAGTVVAAFNGAVNLSDLSGTAVPATVGLFRSGVWTGSIEVRGAHPADVISVVDGLGNGAASNPFAVAPSPVAALGFTTAPRTVTAGECSGPAQPVTLALYDAFGGPTVASGDLALTTAATGGLQLYADDVCSIALTAPAVAAWSPTTTAWFRSTLAGDALLDVSAPSLLGATQLETVLAGPPASLAFVSPPQTVNAGACSQAATLEVRDALGNPATGGPGIALAPTAAAGLELFSDAGCVTPATVVTPAPGAARADFWFRGTLAEVVGVTATSAGLSGASQDETITPEGNASRLVFLTPSRDAVAGGCSDLVTVQAQDSYGNAVSGAGAVQVALTSSPAGALAFFADDACTTPVPAGAAEIGAGRSTTGFHFQGTIAGTVRVTASSTTLTSADQFEQLLPGAPARLAFTSAPQTVTAGSCSGLTSLALRDAFGNLSVTGAPVDVALSAAPPASGFAFYADPLCTTPTGGVTVPSGGSGAGLYFKGLQSGTATVDASASGLAGASQVEQIRAGAPDRLAFATAPQTVTAGVCSGVLTVELRDPNGNAANAPGPTAVGVVAAPAAGFALFSDAACATPSSSPSIPPGSSSVNLFFRGTAAGDVGLTASSAGLGSATQVEAVLPAPADRLVFATPPQSVAAGLCSGPVAVEARDPYGNRSPLPAGATVALSASPGPGFSFHGGEGCGGAPTGSVPIAPGTSGATLSFSGTITGGVTITAASAPLALASQAEAIVPLAPDRLAFATAQQSVGAGNCSEATVVELHDPLGNPATSGTAATVDLSSTASGIFGFFSDSACTIPVTSIAIAAGTTAGQFWFKGVKEEAVTLTAAAAGLSPASQVEQILSAGSASQLVALTPARSVAAGGCSAVVTVEAQDAFGNPIPSVGATAVTLAGLPPAGFAFFADAACTAAIPPAALEIAPGTTSVGFHFRGTMAGTVELTAGAAGLTPAVQVETVVADVPSELAFTSPPQSVKAGTCSAAAGLRLRDPYGNTALAVADVSVTLAAAPPGGFGFYSDAGCGSSVSALSIASGSSAGAFYFLGSTAGSFTVTASAASLGSAPTQVETITPSAPDHLAFSTAPQTVTAGACSSAVTVISRDALGNAAPVAATTSVSVSASPAPGVSLYAGGGCSGAPVAAVTLLASTSSVSFSFRANAAGTVTLTASAVGMTPDPSQAETIVAAAPDRLAWLTAPQTVVAGGCSAAATVQSRDPNGNPAPVGADTAVGLAGAPATGFAFYSDSGCTSPVTSASIGSGANTATFFFAGTRAATVVATASVAGWTAASQSEVVTAATTSRFVWDVIASPQAQSRPFSVRVSAVDGFGNATPAFTGTATLSLTVSPPVSPTPALSCASGCPAGLVTGAFSAGVWTGSVSVGGPESPTDGTPDRWLVATSGAIDGASNAFELTGTPDRSPPLAKIVPTPALIREGQSITFDASGSSDYQTPTANLQVSWDLTGTATATPPAAPWTAWTTTKTVSNTFGTAGTYPIRVAVRDADGDLGYAATTIEVRVMGTSACTVDTSSDLDDGATSCRPWAGTGARGTDGKVSLREALRLAVDGDTINFASPMTISGTGAYTISDRVRILGPGVILDTKSLVIDDGTLADPVEINGLEFTGQTAPVTLRDGHTAVLRDVYLHDGAGIADYGTLTLERVRMARCTGSCVTVYDTAGTDTLTVRNSELRGAGTGTALDVAECAAGVAALSVQSTVFDGFQTAIAVGCPGTTTIVNDSFEANDTGIAYYGLAATAGHVLRNSIFSNERVAAATCGLSTFTQRDYHVLWQNASNGCLDGDPITLTADPLYVFPAAGDFRLRMNSAAVDSAFDLGLHLVPAFPAAPGPRFLGAATDRGGRETY